MSMSERRCARAVLNRVIYEHGTPAGRMFDVILIAAILMSVTVVLLDSVAAIASDYGGFFRKAEWFFTVLFTLEYGLRIFSARKRLKYVFSFFGIVDVLAVLPTYISLLLPEGRFLLTIRVLRLLRVFRVFKLGQFVGQQNILRRALWASRYKVTVFLVSVFTIVVIVGSLMYVIEGEKSGYTSIPMGIYWAVVTLTTVGFGDITPRSPAGQLLATVVMILGYGIIAVPTGIVTVELGRASGKREISCEGCGTRGHDEDAKYCRCCGGSLEPAQ